MVKNGGLTHRWRNSYFTVNDETHNLQRFCWCLRQGHKFWRIYIWRPAWESCSSNVNFETVLGYVLRQRKTTSKDRQVIHMEMNERESRTKVNKQQKRQNRISLKRCLEIQRSEDQISTWRPTIDTDFFSDFPQPPTVRGRNSILNYAATPSSHIPSNSSVTNHTTIWCSMANNCDAWIHRSTKEGLNKEVTQFGS